MLREEKCLEFVFEGRESSRVSYILGEVVPDVRTEVGERAKAMNFSVEASELNMRVSDEEWRVREGLYSCNSSEREVGGEHVIKL